MNYFKSYNGFGLVEGQKLVLFRTFLNYLNQQIIKTISINLNNEI